MAQTIVSAAFSRRGDLLVAPARARDRRSSFLADRIVCVTVAENFTSACGHLDMNCRMIGRVLSVGVGLVGVCFAVGAQQTNWRGATQNDRSTALSLSQPKFFSAKDSSILFHKGPVYAWSDGGRLASNNALAEIGMASLDVFPVAYLPPNTSGVATARKGKIGRAHV